MTFGHVSVSLGDDRYVQLLRDYLYDRLGLKQGIAADGALVAQFIAAAEGRFVYVSFLADRFIALGRERVEPELAAATEGGRSGEALYGLWLAQLDRNFGRKEADRIRQVLCVLAAAELAHGWVFGEGARPDPVDGTSLTMLSEEFAGLPLEVLATVLDSDVADKIETDLEDEDKVITDKHGNPLRKRVFDPVLLFTLERIQGVLRTSRGDAGGRRFRIGLKGLAEVMLHDDDLKAGITRAQAHLASHAMDLVDRLLAEDAPTMPEPLERELIVALLPYAEAAVHLSVSELVAARFAPERVIAVLEQENQRCDDEGRLSLRIGLCSVIAALSWQPCGTTLSELPPEVQNDVLRSLQNRGVAKAKSRSLGEAIADFDAAIAILQDLRDSLESQGHWWSQLSNDLAALFVNRGAAKADSDELSEAIADHDAAIAIMQDLRDSLEPNGQWSIPMRNMHSAALQNRGLDKATIGALREAIADHDAAIAIRQNLRDTLEPYGQWSSQLRNDLAGSLQNRAIAKRLDGALGEAMADCDAAIAIRQDLRETLEPVGQWSIPLRSGFATSLNNRGFAKAYNGALSEAVADYDAAIAIMQHLREMLEPDGQWSISLRTELAAALENRGIDKHLGGAIAEAIADYDAAITIMQHLLEALGPVEQWTISLHNDLATMFVNRHIALEKEGRVAEAKADLIVGIDIQTGAITLAGANAPSAWHDSLTQWSEWLNELTQVRPEKTGLLKRIFKGRSNGN